MDKVSKEQSAIWRLDHTICMNFNEGTLKFNIDNPEDYPDGSYDAQDTDCKDIEDAIECIETLEAAVEAFDIIRNKKVNVSALLYACFKKKDGLDFYNINFTPSLTKEEYKKLKKELL